MNTPAPDPVILAELPKGRARRIRTAGQTCVVITRDPEAARIHVRNPHYRMPYPVIIPLTR